MVSVFLIRWQGNHEIISFEIMRGLGFRFKEMV